MSNPPTSANTVKLGATAITQGVPNLADSNFVNAVKSAQAGGQALKSYFESGAQTSQFWNWMAENAGENEKIFAMAYTQGTPHQLTMIANNGNLSFRMSYFYNEDQSSAADAANAAGGASQPTVVGTGQIQLGNSTTNVSKWTSFGLTVVELPVGMYLTKKLFAGLLKPAFLNAATWIKSNATQLAKKCSAGEDVSYESVSDDSADEADSLLGETGEEAEEAGAEYLAISWTDAMLQIGGMAALAAIPMLVSAAGHPMVATIQVINQTMLDFTWSIGYQASGKANALPGTTATDYDLPKMGTYTDQWGDKTLQPCAYEASFQFINSTDYGSIGLVLTLTPSDGSTPAQIVLSVPWAGTNTLWLGASSASAQSIYEQYSIVNSLETTTVAFDTFQVTAAITGLSGETNGQYAYGVLVNIDKLSS